MLELLALSAAIGLIALVIYRVRQRQSNTRKRAERKLRRQQQDEAWEQMLRDQEPPRP